MLAASKHERNPACLPSLPRHWPLGLRTPSNHGCTGLQGWYPARGESEPGRPGWEELLQQDAPSLEARRARALLEGLPEPQPTNALEGNAKPVWVALQESKSQPLQDCECATMLFCVVKV